ncbi:hypothetical protein [Niveispirillum irakense]|uniref:hypothetical protein n=1 Tax=Niveispirillum irakense TaxID=34011 RepID=UPI000410B0AB|nr:hypothetical protein [Niveispirillum irakense]
MYERLIRPPTAKPNAFAKRAKEGARYKGLGDAMDMPLAGQEDRAGNESLAEILAALPAHPAGPETRLQEVEEAIRRHWTVLRNLVREHADLTKAARQGSMAPALPDTERDAKVTIFMRGRGGVAAE